jgi:predicted  nucleic acid-binding Zn-ribbon protein
VSEPNWVIAIIAVILGAGGIGAFIPLLKLKQDKESSMVFGSEAAVNSLTIALQQSDIRVTILEEENKNLKALIKQLRDDVDASKVAVNNLTKTLNDTKAKLNSALANTTHGTKNGEI